MMRARARGDPPLARVRYTSTPHNILDANPYHKKNLARPVITRRSQVSVPVVDLPPAELL